MIRYGVDIGENEKQGFGTANCTAVFHKHGPGSGLAQSPGSFYRRFAGVAAQGAVELAMFRKNSTGRPCQRQVRRYRLDRVGPEIGPPPTLIAGYARLIANLSSGWGGFCEGNAGEGNQAEFSSTGPFHYRLNVQEYLRNEREIRDCGIHCVRGSILFGGMSAEPGEPGYPWNVATSGKQPAALFVRRG